MKIRNRRVSKLSTPRREQTDGSSEIDDSRSKELTDNESFHSIMASISSSERFGMTSDSCETFVTARDDGDTPLHDGVTFQEPDNTLVANLELNNTPPNVPRNKLLEIDGPNASGSSCKRSNCGSDKRLSRRNRRQSRSVINLVTVATTVPKKMFGKFTLQEEKVAVKRHARRGSYPVSPRSTLHARQEIVNSGMERKPVVTSDGTTEAVMASTPTERAVAKRKLVDSEPSRKAILMDLSPIQKSIVAHDLLRRSKRVLASVVKLPRLDVTTSTPTIPNATEISSSKVVVTEQPLATRTELKHCTPLPIVKKAAVQSTRKKYVPVVSHVTFPVSPTLATTKRAQNRPAKPIDYVPAIEREQIEAEEMKKFQFRAKPMPGAIPRSSAKAPISKSFKPRTGELHLKTSVDIKPTVRQSPIVTKKELSSATNALKNDRSTTRTISSSLSSVAIRLPSAVAVGQKNIIGGPSVSTATINKKLATPQKKVDRTSVLHGVKKQPLKVTAAKTPNVVRRTRQQKLRTAQMAALMEVARQAREEAAKRAERTSRTRLMKHALTTQPTIHRNTSATKHVTVPLPFSFEDHDRIRHERKEQKIRQQIEEEKRLAEFHANPLPKALHVTHPLGLPPRQPRPPTQPEPFALSEVQSHVCSSECSSTVEYHEFKAQALPDMTKVFIPEHPEREPVRPLDIVLHTEARAEQRKHFDEYVADLEREREEAREQREEVAKVQEEIERKELRKSMVTQANAIRHYKPVAPPPVHLTTVPESPMLVTKTRAANRRLLQEQQAEVVRAEEELFKTMTQPATKMTMQLRSAAAAFPAETKEQDGTSKTKLDHTFTLPDLN